MEVGAGVDIVDAVVVDIEVKDGARRRRRRGE